ncbi:MAG: NUDIX hydrolase [Tistlia sp.]|uniref:NUDIX hydrolase n=1 Tax=Tistlia sp. TaxID=3057121 RepID=UPI0034A5CBFE
MDAQQQPSFSRRIPEGDDRERPVCDACGFVDYQNPKVVVGSVALWENRILLCRRAIEPRSGFWTLPAGYLELNEATADGARREAWEEARAELEIERLLAVYTILRLSQVQLIYRARLLHPAIAPGPESRECGLFDWKDIPWDEIAFPSVHWALGHWRETRDRDGFAPFANPPGETGRLERPQGL